MDSSTPTVRDAVPLDREPIREIAAITWRATYAGLLTPDEIEACLTELYEPSLLARQIELAQGDSDDHFLVAEVDGEVSAYLHCELLADRGPYLQRIYVLPSRQGMGLGMALISELHARLGAGTVYELDVHPENHRAVEFYRRLGAEWTGERKEPFSKLMRIEVSAGTSNPYRRPEQHH